MSSPDLDSPLHSDPVLSNISLLGLDPGWVTTNIARNSSTLVTCITRSFRFLAPLFKYLWPNHYLRMTAKTGDDLVRVCFDGKKFSEFPKALYVDGIGDWSDDE
jgi:hypothetical protein